MLKISPILKGASGKPPCSRCGRRAWAIRGGIKAQRRGGKRDAKVKVPIESLGERTIKMDQTEGNALAGSNTPGSGAVTQPGWPGGSVGQGRVNEVDWGQGGMTQAISLPSSGLVLQGAKYQAVRLHEPGLGTLAQKQESCIRESDLRERDRYDRSRTISLPKQELFERARMRPVAWEQRIRSPVLRLAFSTVQHQWRAR